MRKYPWTDHSVSGMSIPILALETGETLAQEDSKDAHGEKDTTRPSSEQVRDAPPHLNTRRGHRDGDRFIAGLAQARGAEPRFPDRVIALIRYHQQRAYLAMTIVAHSE